MPACQASDESDEAVADPGAAVAMGSPLVVRLMVPAWIVNSTPLPISAAVVRMQRPQPPAPEAGGAHTSSRDPVPLMKVAAAMTSIKVFETGFQFKCDLFPPSHPHPLPLHPPIHTPNWGVPASLQKLACPSVHQIAPVQFRIFQSIRPRVYDWNDTI